MTGIAILGLGNFGTALARVWSLHGHQTRGWTVEQVVHDSIRETGANTKYLPGVTLPGVSVSMELRWTIEGAEIVILALPSHVILDVVDDAVPLLSDDQILLDLAKGLAPNQRLISEVIEDTLAQAGKRSELAVMTGPTIARELAAGVLSTALVASHDMRVAERLTAQLSTKTLHLRCSDDRLGVELWGAFKNIIALACGVCDGLTKSGIGGDNLKAAIFKSGFAEGNRLTSAMGAQPDTSLSAAGIGDLFVTATSAYGRNRRTGELLGQGTSANDAMTSTVMVSEGVRATEMFQKRAAAQGLSAPFVDTVFSLIEGKIDARRCVEHLLQLE